LGRFKKKKGPNIFFSFFFFFFFFTFGFVTETYRNHRHYESFKTQATMAWQPTTVIIHVQVENETKWLQRNKNHEFHLSNGTKACARQRYRIQSFKMEFTSQLFHFWCFPTSCSLFFPFCFYSSSLVTPQSNSKPQMKVDEKGERDRMAWEGGCAL